MWSLSKRLAAFCCASLTASAALLSADNADFSDDFYGQQNYGETYYDGSCGECSDSHWSFGAEYLYWKAHVDGLPMSRVVKRSEHVTVTSVGGTEIDIIDSQYVNTSYRHPHFKWNSGVRLNLGYKQPDCVWDLCASWTWLYSHGHSNQCVVNGSSNGSGCGSGGGSGGGSGSGSGGSSGDTISLETAWSTGLRVPFDYDEDAIASARAHGHWSMNYNVLEFGIGHLYNACGCFTLRPHVDLKVAWINQRVRASLHREIATTVGTEDITGFVIETTHAKRRFTGIGPQFGFDASYDLGSGWNLFAKAAGAILYAEPRFHTHAIVHADINSSAGSLIVNGKSSAGNEGHHSHRSRNHHGHLFYNPSIGGGLGWNSWLCDNSYLVSLRLGWEHHLYFDQNNFQRNTSIQGGEDRGNLSLYGLTVALGLDY